MSNQKKIVVAMNTVLSGLISKSVSSTNKADGARGKALQGFIDGNWTEAHFWAPSNEKSAATEESYAFLVDAVVDGFPATERALIQAESTEGWSKAKKEKRRKAQQRIGARIADFRKGVARATAKPASRAPNRRRSIQQVVIEDVGAIVKKLQDFNPTDKDNGGGMDIPGIIKELQDAVKLAKG